MVIAFLFLTIGLLVSGALLCVAQRAVPDFWKKGTAEYTAERIEKACDSVTSFVAFLIPATLAVTTWVSEKTGTLWYGAFLALSTLWFLVVLVGTMYMRFNFVWRFPDRVKVSKSENMEVPRWLTTVMVGLTLGLLFLAVPTFFIAFRAPSGRAKIDEARSSSQRPPPGPEWSPKEKATP